MAILEFLLLTFKTDLQPDPSTPPAAFADLISKFKAIPGVLHLYLGQIIENPRRWQYIVHWESIAAIEAFGASLLIAELQSALGPLLNEPPFMSPPTEYTHDAEAALTAPCTEICTCWGAEEDFHEQNMKPFADPVAAAGLSGYHGMGRATFEQAAQADPYIVPGRASRIILGWDSVEAHMQHKGVNSVIDKYVHLLMEHRKELELYHVPLKQL